MGISKSRISFPNGWAIDVHDERGGETYYQRWPPGVQNQGMFDNLFRKDSWQFRELVEAEGGEYEA